MLENALLIQIIDTSLVYDLIAAPDISFHSSRILNRSHAFENEESRSPACKQNVLRCSQHSVSTLERFHDFFYELKQIIRFSWWKCTVRSDINCWSRFRVWSKFQGLQDDQFYQIRSPKTFKTDKFQETSRLPSPAPVAPKSRTDLMVAFAKMDPSQGCALTDWGI